MPFALLDTLLDTLLVTINLFTSIFSKGSKRKYFTNGQNLGPLHRV